MRAYWAIAVIVSILIIGAIGFENSFLLGQAYADFTLFEDDFNRPDNTALGGFWVEEELGLDSVEILNNKMIWNADNAADSPFAQHGFLIQESIAEATFTVSMEINIDQVSESTYEWWFQLGDGSLMGNPTSDVEGVAVSIKTGGDGETGSNAGEFVAVNGLSFIELTGGNEVHGTIDLFISVDMSTQTYDVTISGPGVAGGPHVTNSIGFENSVDIDTIRFWMDGLQEANFNPEETIDDLIITSTVAGEPGVTGQIFLDKSLYPIPFGDFGNFAMSDGTFPDGRSLFPVHQLAMVDGVDGLQAGETLGQGILELQIQIIDPDFDLSSVTEDVLSTLVQVFADNCTGVSTPVASCVDVDTAEVGPIKIIVTGPPGDMVLGYAGGPSVVPGLIDVGDDNPELARQFGPITEVAPDGGVFEIKIPILYTDGTASTDCPNTTSFESLVGGGTAETDRFDTASAAGENYCVENNNGIKVQYTDPQDATGGQTTKQDSASFVLHDAALQIDKTVVVGGIDIIMTLIAPDLDLDGNEVNTISLDVIGWTSPSAILSIGPLGGQASAFDPEPSTFTETGDKTGIYQVVLEVPSILSSNTLQEGEVITLSFQDWSLPTSGYVGVGSIGNPVPKVSSVQMTMFDTTPTTVAGPVINSDEQLNGFEIIAPLGILVEPDLFPKVLVPSGTEEGDTVRLLLNGDNFPSVLTHVVTSDDIEAGAISFTISAGQLGADGPKIILYVVTDPIGNIKFNSGQLEIILDASIPSVLRVKCTHTPLLFVPGVQTTILAEAVDGNGDPVVADALKIWTVTPGTPGTVALQNAGSSTLSYSETFTESNIYGCQASIGGNLDVFSGWKFLIESPDGWVAHPIQLADCTNCAIDIMFVPDEASYPILGFSDPKFLTDVSTAMNNFLDEPTFLQNQDKFNFWIAEDFGQSGRNAAGDCLLAAPANWATDYSFVDSGAVLHPATFRDCASISDRIYSSEPFTRTLIHETGHSPFGLADEYCNPLATPPVPCDGGYFVAKPSGSPTNLYETQADCDIDPFNSGKTCRMFTADDGEDWYTSDPLSNDVMVDRLDFQPLDLRRLNWLLDMCSLGMC